MTALITDRITTWARELPRQMTKPVGVDIIYQGGLVAPNASGYLLPGGAAGALDCIAVSLQQVDNSAGSAGDKSARVEAGYFALDNSSGGDEITELDLPAIIFCVDDQTAAKTNAGDRRIAGIGITLDEDGNVMTLVAPWVPILAGILADLDSAGGLDTPPSFAAEAVATSNIASLAAFTVAHDGLTLTAGEKVVLVGQTTKSQNGLYVVGTVATGTAPLTRHPAADTGSELPPGTSCYVRAGTIGAGRKYILGGAGLLTVGTDDQVWDYVMVGSKGTGTLSSGTVTVADARVKANSTVLVFPKTLSGSTDFSYLSVGTIVAGTSFVVAAFTVAHAADTDCVGDFHYVILN